MTVSAGLFKRTKHGGPKEYLELRVNLLYVMPQITSNNLSSIEPDQILETYPFTFEREGYNQNKFSLVGTGGIKGKLLVLTFSFLMICIPHICVAHLSISATENPIKAT